MSTDSPNNPPDFLISPLPSEAIYVWGGAQDIEGFQLAKGEEEAIAGDVSAKRREEFTRGRACAHAALEQLAGRQGVVALPGFPSGHYAAHADHLAIRRQGRAPQWPTGVVGAITHSHGAAAAAVARREDFLGIGIDLEPESPSLERVASRICHPDELAVIADLPPSMQLGHLAVIFSIKESIYKALNPATGIYLGFQDAKIDMNTGGQGAGAEGFVRWKLLKDCTPVLEAGFQGEGKYLRQDGWTLSGVWVRA